MKYPRCPLFAQYGDAGYRFLDAVQSAAVLGDRDPRAIDLARTRLVTQLRDEFVDLGEAGGADRVPLRFQPAGWIDRNSAANRGLAAFADEAAVTESAQAEIFNLNDLAHRGGVMHLSD